MDLKRTDTKTTNKALCFESSRTVCGITGEVWGIMTLIPAGWSETVSVFYNNLFEAGSSSLALAELSLIYLTEERLRRKSGDSCSKYCRKMTFLSLKYLQAIFLPEIRRRGGQGKQLLWWEKLSKVSEFKHAVLTLFSGGFDNVYS